MRKNDLFLAGAVFVVAGIIFLYQIFRSDEGKKELLITVDGEDYGTYDMSEDQIVEIGSSNILVIRDGSAQMEWADCPDQICVRHKEIEKSGESIICLPNRVVASVESSEESELDGVAR